MKQVRLNLNGGIQYVEQDNNLNVCVYYLYASKVNLIAEGNTEDEAKAKVVQWAIEQRSQALYDAVRNYAEWNNRDEDYDYDEVLNEYINDKLLDELCSDIIDSDYEIIEWNVVDDVVIWIDDADYIQDGYSATINAVGNSRDSYREALREVDKLTFQKASDLFHEQTGQIIKGDVIEVTYTINNSNSYDAIKLLRGEN